MDTNHMPSKFGIKLKNQREQISYLYSESHSSTINLICSLVGLAYDVTFGDRNQISLNSIKWEWTNIYKLPGLCIQFQTKKKKFFFGNSVFWIPVCIFKY